MNDSDKLLLMWKISQEPKLKEQIDFHPVQWSIDTDEVVTLWSQDTLGINFRGFAVRKEDSKGFIIYGPEDLEREPRCWGKMYDKLLTKEKGSDANPQEALLEVSDALKRFMRLAESEGISHKFEGAKRKFKALMKEFKERYKEEFE